MGYPARGANGTRTGPYAPQPGPRQPDGLQGYEPYPSVRPGPSRQTSGGGGGGRFIDYPRYGKDGWRRWVPSWKQNLSVFGLGVVLLILLFSVLYATTTVPAVDQKVLAQTTIFYYGDGKTEIGRLATQNRQNIELNTLQAYVPRAVLAAEDRTFYNNSGVNPTSIVRAAWSNARGNQTQGGSTITQQYVKNVYAMQKNRTIMTKVRELFIALKINQSIGKPEILQSYLNTIYFGRGAYGIQAASQAYFHKDAKDLNVNEAAYLAGVINAPSLADEPDRKHRDEYERADRRRNVVLDAMVTQGWLTSEQRQQYAKFPKVYPDSQGSSLSGQKGFLVKMAQTEAEKRLTAELGRTVTDEDIETGGYKIVTTFNKRLMDAGVAAVKEVLPTDRTPKRVKVGMAAIDPSSGAVRAIYGGKDWNVSQFNQATQARAEGGSTFKAFGLLAALENDVSLRSRFRGTSPMTIDGKKIKNFGNEQFYNTDLLNATKHSVNTVYVQLNEKVGRKKALDVALRAGLPKDANMQANLVNVLGSANPHAIDMAAAYATFAAQGTQHDPYTIKSISKIDTGAEKWNDDGKTGGKKDVFDKGVMADLTYALQQPIQGGTGSYAQALGRPAAGKTGTSNDSRSAWFVGYTPQLSVAVAMYQTSKDGTRNVEMQPWGGFSAITGGSFPVQVWTKFMQAAMRPYPVEQFPQPVYGGETIGIPAPQPTYTPEPTEPSESPSEQPSQSPTEQPSSPVTLPSFGLPGQDGTQQQSDGTTSGQ